MNNTDLRSGKGFVRLPISVAIQIVEITGLVGPKEALDGRMRIKI